MTIRINPFNPSSPVNPGVFVGRLGEVVRLEQSLLQTRAGNPAHFMLTGERGIGKSSLLLYFKYVAEGAIAIEGENLKFLIVDTDVDPTTTQLGLVQRIQSALDRQLAVTEPAKNFLKETWSFLQRVQVMDSGIVGVESARESHEVLLDNFAYSLASVANRTCENPDPSLFNAKYDGILILIDEADNCASDLRLGSFLKLLLERIQRHGCNRVLVGLAGLPELRSKLQASHPSSLRIFEEIELNRLPDNEVSQIVDRCLAKANLTNIQKTEITAEARAHLIAYSEGYPHFIQQFGYSAFAADTDGIVDDSDITKGSFGRRGALDLIGDRYYRNDFYNKIQKDIYRQVLRIMADDLDGWVTRQKISEKFKGNGAILNNAIKALRDRHIILSKEGERGVYRLQHKGFAVWIKLYTKPTLENGPITLTTEPSSPLTES
ncbi:MAG TPA: ATP-binding protein [Candidatus Omnitrophica bacterium]|nr:ATP-binding protein [Candidatus Omnitrophota bacterium]